MKVRCTNEISRLPACVFPWIAEPTKAMQWQKDVKRTEIIINTPEVQGTTFKEIVDEDGRELEMTGVVTQFSPNEQIAFHLSSRIHEFDVSYELRETGNGTRISVEAIIRWKFPMNILILFLGKRMQKQLAEQLHSDTQQLKAICELE